jgi:hypothetical protein
MNRSVCFGILVMAFMTWSESSGQSIDNNAVLVERDPDLNKLICGPRCVKHVLKYYGHDADLSDLVREIQWPEYQKGATMAALAKSLERRGVHVRAVVLPKAAPLEWAYPVILHFVGEPIGHFTVLTPSNGGVTLWINERRDESFSSGVCFKNRTEIVLLTSDHEITDDDLSRIVRGHLASELQFAALSFLPLLLLLFLIQWKKLGRRLIARKILPPASAANSSDECGNVFFTRKEGVFMRCRYLSLVFVASVGLWLLCSAYFVVLALADGMSVGYAVSLDDASLQAVGGGQVGVGVGNGPPCYRGDEEWCDTTGAIECHDQPCSYYYSNGNYYYYCNAIGYTGNLNSYYWKVTGGWTLGWQYAFPSKIYCLAKLTCYNECTPNPDKGMRMYCLGYSAYHSFGNPQNVVLVFYNDCTLGD